MKKSDKCSIVNLQSCKSTKALTWEELLEDAACWTEDDAPPGTIRLCNK